MTIFALKTWTKLVKKNLWLDRYVGKGFWAKKSAQLVIPVRSTFQNDLHPPIGGPHPLLYFTTQTTKKYCTAMCYLAANPFQLLKCLFPDLSFFCCDCNLGIVIWENFVTEKNCWKQTYCLIKWQFFLCVQCPRFCHCSWLWRMIGAFMKSWWLICVSFSGYTMS